MVKADRGIKEKTRQWGGIAVLLILLVAAMLFAAGCGIFGGKEESKIKTNSTGKWVKTQVISEYDGKPHDAEIKLVSIDKDKESVEKQIEEYNLSAEGTTIDLEEKSGKSYVIASYQIKYPDDFPADSLGMAEPGATFEITNTEGGSMFTKDDTTYEGLNETIEIGELSPGSVVYPGQIYEGKFVFLMIDDFSDYLIKQTCPAAEDGGEETAVYFEGV